MNRKLCADPECLSPKPHFQDWHEATCPHPSLDGLAGTDILVCMSCSRLVRRFGYMDIDGIPLTGYHDLNCIEVKTLFGALEARREAESAELQERLDGLKANVAMRAKRTYARDKGLPTAEDVRGILG